MQTIALLEILISKLLEVSLCIEFFIFCPSFLFFSIIISIARNRLFQINELFLLIGYKIG